MAAKQLWNWTPHSQGQLDWFVNEHMIKVAACGRRWGKSESASVDIATYFLAQPNHKQAIIAPGYKQASIIYRAVKNRLLAVPSLRGKLRFPTQPMPAVFWEDSVSGSPQGEILVFSMDNPDSARGFAFHRVFVDEAALISDTVVDEIISPFLADYEGQLTAISTPKGQNWFHREYMRGFDPEFQEYVYSQCQPSIENPFLSRKYLALQKAIRPERAWLQEYEAQFLSDAGGVFHNVESIVRKGFSENLPPFAGRVYVVGWDSARLQDYTVITVLDTTTGEQVFWKRYNLDSWEKQLADVALICKRYNNATCIFDATGQQGDILYESLRRRDVYCQPYALTSTSKQNLIDNLSLLVENKGLILMDQHQQTLELKIFEQRTTPSGNIKYGAPAGYHDDCVISLGLASWGLAPTGGWWQDKELLTELAARYETTKTGPSGILLAKKAY